ncbi:MFS transporter [Actinoallomurus rhizosphaericola]|uniref:MFS transporter n=1 Tax=Actinoallomurus rhizosphaericola TaxID=2952536 RepID=UPI002093A9F7|nr:MFS transporter [Actinoallomurus rhizosphaericola]MCO5997007.1 MFS transporter [Actinoallomurus rhizosphaericola]
MFRIVATSGPARTLAAAQLVGSLGDGAFYACSVLFFTRVVGLSPARVGFALTLGWAVGMLAGVPLGRLADRWGPRRTAVALAAATAATLAAFLMVRSFPLFTVAFAAYACCQAGLTSARQALLAGLVPAGERTGVRAAVQSASNAGLAAGAGLGALALCSGTRPAYLAVFGMDAAAFAAAGLVLSRLPEAPAAGPRAHGPRTGVLRDRPYALVTFCSAVMYLNMPLLSLGLPLWIVRRTGAPAPMAAVLLVVNMLSVVLFQVRVARPVTGPAAAARATRRAGVLMAAACAVYAMSGAGSGVVVTVVLLVAGALVQVFGEMLHGAGGWELSFALAPEGRHGQYQGFYGMAPQCARMAGPLVLTTLLLGWGGPGWLLLGAAFLAAGAAMGPVTRYAERAHAAPRVAVRTGACG